MSLQLVKKFQKRLEDLIRHGGSRNETSVRAAFQTLLSEWAEGSGDNLRLIPELSYRPPGQKNTVYPDGTIKDSLQQARGYWESKDESDTLADEIQKKFARGYPKDNIIFEDSSRAVLIQHGETVMQVEMNDAPALELLLRAFFAFVPPEVTQFRQAIERFRAELPGLLTVLRSALQAAEAQPAYRQQRDLFIEIGRKAMSPVFNQQDAGEMLIQHILTGEIFRSVFDNAQYFEENNVAQQLEKLAHTFYVKQVRRDVETLTKPYYGAIRAAASKIADHHEKQRFLKVLYENFYRAYNPAGADRLGIFYTPGEIVRFMIEATDTLLERHFGKELADRGVEILDPATGTGTFITELIDYLPSSKLAYKYEHELHCNELALLPYYIANLNIEATYEQKTGKYAEFRNIVLVDTLDNTGFGIRGESDSLFTSFSAENLERVKRQNERPLKVIIGNPPYRANQANENDNNKNREYPKIDKRIKDTYIAQSTAQKTKLYDMYARFLRWATDRLKDDGIVAFVSNNSFVDARTFDGFRSIVSKEFSYIYIINMRGNANTSGPRRKAEGGNVFNDQIKVGVAVYFLIKSNKKQDCVIKYIEVPDAWTAEQKKTYLRDSKIDQLDFERIRPDAKHNWLDLADAGSDWASFLPVADKETKNAKTYSAEKAIFKLYSLGVITSRDEWVYDVSHDLLTKKINMLIDSYNLDVKDLMNGMAAMKGGITIKWSRAVKADLAKYATYSFSEDKIRRVYYRPFSTSLIYFDTSLNEVQYQMPLIFPKDSSENRVIAVNVSDSPFNILASDRLVDYHFNGDSQCLPLYRYVSGQRVENVTDYALKAFRAQYADASISHADIFHYVYAVLHHPAYREKYAPNLRQEFPRVPFYPDFRQWASWGVALMRLHLDFETAQRHALTRVELPPKNATPEALALAQKAKLKADRAAGSIVLDGLTTLHGVPAAAWTYRLGNRSALEWVLERHKESKPKDPTIRERFDSYRFADHKERVIELLERVTTVSVETVRILSEMPAQTL